ncbi:MAG: class I SAM-dependent methyltransferase [Sulfurospirillaceae bacterium]|nr:class I SAM-dependent methyltransferase [Sulfurospirillaceae bacterium]
MFDIKKDNWESSYAKGQNFIYYPKEETVKFLNRFIKKKKSLNKYIQLIDSPQKLRGLDFGCGIGRMTILLHEFDIDGYGIDISQNAIVEAKKLSEYFGFNLEGFLQAYDGEKIPFDDNYFDFTISEGVLDSMPFELAKRLIKDIDRVTKKYFFLSLISVESADIFRQVKDKEFFDGEVEVEEEHEKGTIQSLFSRQKIEEFIKDTNFKIKWCELHTVDSCISNYQHGRWYLVLEK